MHNFLGFSLYLSTSPAQCPALGGRAGAGAPIFLSLHISEEFDDSFCARAEQLCHSLADQGFRVIADVSTKTVKQFGCADLTDLARHLRLWALRIDYGFSAEEIGAMADKLPIVLNASTTTPEEARIIAVADTFDAMTSDRQYRKSLGFRRAMEELERCKGTQLDANLTTLFQTMLRDKDFWTKMQQELQDCAPVISGADH